MKKQPMKFREGDRVQLLDDLTEFHLVKKTYVENVSWGGNPVFAYPRNRVVLSNGKVYDEDALTFYSYPIQLLAGRIKELEKNPTKQREQGWDSLLGIAMITAFSAIGLSVLLLIVRTLITKA